MASSVDRKRMFPSVFFHLIIAIFKETFKLFGPQGCPDDKNWVDFSSIFFLTFADFAVQFCFCCKFSFHEKPLESSLTVAWFFLTNHNSLLCIAANEIASFCIDKMCLPADFRVIEKDFELCVVLLYKTNNSMLPCVCSVIDHRGRQNVARTSPRVPLFCSYHILTSSVIYYWTDARQHGIYLLNRNTVHVFYFLNNICCQNHAQRFDLITGRSAVVGSWEKWFPVGNAQSQHPETGRKRLVNSWNQLLVIRVISLSFRLQLITATLIILDITKTSSNNCF